MLLRQPSEARFCASGSHAPVRFSKHAAADSPERSLKQVQARFISSDIGLSLVSLIGMPAKAGIHGFS